MPDSTTTTTSSTSTSSDSTNISSTLSSTKSTYDSTANKPAIFLGSVRTYVAGVLMPTIAVNISCSFGAFPQATVTLPADPRLFNVGYKDRVPVQVFVKETVAESSNYIMMFEGFIAAKSYMSVASQREINLMCVSYLEVFRDTKLKFMQSIPETFDGSTPGQNSLAQNVFMGIGFPMVLFQTGLGLKTEANGGTVKYINCPTQYLSNLMQYMEEAGTTHAGAGRFNDSIVSQYYATLAYNLKFSRRFCWLPYFDFKVETKDDASTDSSKTGQNATQESDYGACWEADGVTDLDTEATMFPVMYGLKTAKAAETLAGMAQQSSTEFSMYDLINYLLGEVEYEFLAIANPAFQAKKPGDDEGAKLDEGRATKVTNTDGGGPKQEFKAPSDELKDDPNKDEILKNLDKKYERTRNCDRMIQFCMKPMFDDTFPPKCNIVFRSQVIQLSANWQYNQVPTRIQVMGFDPFAGLVAQTGGSSNALQLFSQCDFYPSNYFAEKYDELTKDGSVMGPGDRGLQSEKLEDNEKWTGPWITRNQAPAWLTYAWGRDTFSGEDQEADRKNRLKMREQYMRRQLMRAQILSRTLNASCVFLPYITCGFPAVIYDSADTGFSFAGNVIAYEHQFSAAGMSTSVTLNGVRLLAEAIAAEKKGEYPNPINCVHAITHNVKALNKVYAAILGTPDASVSGAEALDWETVRTTYSGVVTDVTTSPQTNIYEAYKLQRRNIITQSDYCTFMGLTQTPSGTDESGNPPTEITNDWITDRAQIDVYQIIPLLQQVKPVEKLAQDQKKTEKSSETKAEEKAETNEAQSELDKEEASYAQCVQNLNNQYAEAIAKAQAAGIKYTGTGDPSEGYPPMEYDHNDPAQVSAVTELVGAATKCAYYARIQQDWRRDLDSRQAEAAEESEGSEEEAATEEPDVGKESNQLFSESSAKAANSAETGTSEESSADASGSSASTDGSSGSSTKSAYEESNKKAAETSSSPTGTDVRAVLKAVAEECWANNIY